MQLTGPMWIGWSQTLMIFAYALVSCLVVNDAVKVAIIKWRVPIAVAWCVGIWRPQRDSNPCTQIENLMS